jgi:uncharacterized membrane protein
MQVERRSHRATVAGILIGIGMGGFVDGIVLHQMAQWHNMLSNIVPPHTMDTMRMKCATVPDAASPVEPGWDSE